jgi:diadenosine tetraphosphate (Ap4A) HIT family hydrolase
MSDLLVEEQHYLMGVVFAVERSLRILMNPDKINLASLGNQVPHLHWHVIARFTDDRHFPASIWSPAQGIGHARAAPANAQLAAHIAHELDSR